MKLIKRLISFSLALACVAGCVPKVYADDSENNHIATYIGEVPKGIEWDASVTANTFGTLFETVKATAADGTVYSVEVIPENTVYFVDCIDRDYSKHKTTPSYQAVKNLVGDSLLNEYYDCFAYEDNSWGLIDNDAVTKSYTSADDKTMTGYYGKYNANGETLDYQFPLEAGTYTVSSAHYEWWDAHRPMNIVLEIDGKSYSAGSITVSTGSRFKTNSATFTLKKAGVVKFTVMATGSQAPVLSWICINKADGEKDTVTLIKEETEAKETAMRNVIINGADVEAAANNVNGLTYKGFAMLSCNSTSNLLLDYKTSAPEKYWELLEYLFGGENPVFTHIKIEMGNDGNNSTGADACTMRYENEEADASRSPGFALAADVKKINPEVKVSVLRWCMPRWVEDVWWGNPDNKGYEAMYKWYSETIFDAYEKYGYVVDFVNPDTNETGDPDQNFIKWIAKEIENETNFPLYFDKEAKEQYRNIKIIASDENKSLNIVPEMRSDKELYDAVDIIGFHYRTDATADYVKMADVDDKEVWYSEGCAVFGYTELSENKNSQYGKNTFGGFQSPLAMADSFLVSFSASRRTHYIFQPAIGSFYEGLQYGHKELISARDPWSGYIHYDPSLYMLEHITSFAKTGWENETNTNGIWRALPQASFGSFEGNVFEHTTAEINGKASAMTLVSPDKKDFSVVFVNNTKNDKYCEISANDMLFEGDTLKVWQTVSNDYMSKQPDVKLENGVWKISVPAYSVVTATTLYNTPARLPAEGIRNEERTVLDMGGNVLYEDDFNYSDVEKVDVYNLKKDKTTKVSYLESRGNEPRYMLDTHGAWIVEKGRLKQELTTAVSEWNRGDPMTIVGDFRWMDYSASVDVSIPAGAYASIAIRTQTGMNRLQSGYTLELNSTGEWKLYAADRLAKIGMLVIGEDNSLKLSGFGNKITAEINGEVVCEYIDENPMLSGRVTLSSSVHNVYFDNLKVCDIIGGTTYADEMFDGQDDRVSYEGRWTIDNPGGGSADNWYRTLSNSGANGDSFTFDVTGNGFALIGPNTGDAVLDIYIDGELAETACKTAKTACRYEFYSLNFGETKTCEVKVVVKSGRISLDAIYALGKIADVEEKPVKQENDKPAQTESSKALSPLGIALAVAGAVAVAGIALVAIINKKKKRK